MASSSSIGLNLFLTVLCLTTFCSTSLAQDTLNLTQTIRNGQTLVSPGGTFELGFFTPGSSRWYLGMWFRNIPGRTIVWVANRAVPITNTSGVALRVVQPGTLVLASDSNGVIWSSNSSARSLQNPIAQLLETGNLVVRDENENDDRPENFAWQSFYYPTDTYLSGMPFGRNLVTGLDTHIVSWRSVDDPAPGDYSFPLDPTGLPQILLRRGNDVVYRIGPWNGLRFSGAPDATGDTTYRLTFINNENEVRYIEETVDSSVISRFNVNQSTGLVQRWTWVERRGWVNYLNMPTDICDNYGLCGAYGICNIGNSPACGCLDRFVPRNPNDWVRTDWTGGCVRRRNLSCETGDAFIRYSGVKLPDVRNSWHNTSMTLDECRVACFRNCSCMAYTQLDISRGIGCLIWNEELVDIRRLSSNGQDVYIRMSSSESDSGGDDSRILIASLTSVSAAILLGIGLFLFIRKKKSGSKMTAADSYSGSHHRDPELPMFDFPTILRATDEFSLRNKIGEGGFGSVYKGVMHGGQEIAVKRLAKDSMQGLNEFKNEVIFIAKLQHRNLVRLLGCCIEGEETMLIYEYMPNKSLDYILFDKNKSMLLDWPKRFDVINGIARGLLYLHQDSRLRIIHRDLKASNVLLDSEMKPKISDFGMARSFGGNEFEAKTRRVVGTYGYMAPEYAVDGLFSVKSDVFSFGVLVLEIVSGKRNRGFSHNNHNFNLLGHAWTLYKEGRSLELADRSLQNSFYIGEILRSIHVGILCVQQSPEDRPSMSSVVQMLGNEGACPEAKQPGFFTERDVFAAQSSTSTNVASSTNEMTITMPEGR